MKTVYLASPYSHRNRSVEVKRYLDVTKVAALLTRDLGVPMFLPITQSYKMVEMIPALGGSFEKWKKIDLTWVGRSDELWVVMLDGWDKSIGVLAEIRHAKRLKKKIRYIEYDGKNYKFVN